ncbi:MAG: hypothetical protein AAGB04_12570 [Pseudomonadota bacterium]
MSRQPRSGTSIEISEVVTVFVSTLVALVRFAAMVVLELALAIMTYVYLALYDLETFGALVKFSKGILDSAISWMEFLMPELSNRAYATLLGELGPKAMLLLLVGLVVGAIIRFVAWVIVRALQRT